MMGDGKQHVQLAMEKTLLKDVTEVPLSNEAV